ncbi:MAG TPA: hypothetical protein VFE18_05270 [Phenylobacterium sp.]|jgi:hypothetical protein|uniref:hypothetical protein n=1 Tax=Phenylobacterium sp. TaxID=1871053 RepID=UPI002D4414F0|nr:hypothetical protein [Phenylobacterium sp.]HZZ67564.1 hypothetical protein [Phenylobacterium sp.]
MTKPSPRAVAAPSPLHVVLAMTLTVIVSLALLLAPRLGHAAPAGGDAAVLGKWISDKNDPAMDYSVAAGTAAGTLRLIVPPKALGRKTGETVVLKRVSPTRFESVPDSILRGSFTLTGPKRAEFRAMENTPKSFGIVDQLLERP